MSLSERLHDVAFTEALRGYNPVEVDAFLAEIAAAVEQLLGRVQALEAAAARPATGGDPDGSTVARALLLAQRAADIAAAEAEESARRVREHAEAEAARLLGDARAEAAALTAAARTAAETAMADLERKREPLAQSLAAIHARAVQCRDGLREVLSDQALALDGWLAANPIGDSAIAAVAPVTASGPPPVLRAHPWIDEPTVEHAVDNAPPPHVTIPPPPPTV